MGGVLGGWLTTVLMQVMPVHNLFLVVSVILGICIFLSTLLWKQARKGPVVPVEAFVPEHEPLHKKTGHLDVPAYLFLLGALVVIAKMTSTIVENQFAGVVEQTVTGKQAMAAFYGNFYAWLNLFSFLAQFILTAAFLRRFGTLGSIWMLPAGLAVLSVWNLCAVSLVAAVVYRMYDGTMNYSVQQASKEILYLPLSSKTRRQVKPWIDMLGFRGAKTLAGLFMIAGTLLFHLPTTGMGYLVLALIPWWMLVLVLLRKKIQPVVKL